MNWLLNRLKEKSTWLAIFTFAGLFGMQIEPELRDKLMDAILAVAALVAFIFRESIRDTANSDQVHSIELQGRSEYAVPNMDAVHTDVPKDSNDRVHYFGQHQVVDWMPMQSKPQPATTKESGWNG